MTLANPGKQTLVERSRAAVIDLYAKHAANLAMLCALLVAYYLVSYLTSHTRTKTPGSTYVAMCVVFANILSAALGLFVWMKSSAARLPRALWITTLAGVVVLGSLQAYYIAAWIYSVPDTRLPLSYRLTKELIVGLHVVVSVQLSTMLLLGREIRKTTLIPALRDYSLLPLCVLPLVTYHSRNREYFTPSTTVEYFALLLFAPICFITAAKCVERLSGASLDTAPVVVVMTWMFYARPGISSLLLRPVESSVFLMLAILLVFMLIMSTMHARQPRWTASLAMLLLLSTAVQAYLLETGTETSPSAQARPTRIPNFLARPFQKKPDIYFLVYDAYSPEITLRQRGIDNSQQMLLLREKGFTFYDKSYTVVADSKESISRVLDMASPPLHPIGGNNLVNAVLRREGYRTHLVVTPYFLQDALVFGADNTFPSRTAGDGLKSVYTGIRAGEFKAEFAFSFSDRGRGREDWLRQKRDVLEARTPYPKFLYAHSPYPSHSQISGSCLPNETELFADRLKLANEEMRVDLDSILNSNREAIIVVAGDHGPFLTGDCHHLYSWEPSRVTANELADRYGAFLAIRWPESAPVRFDEIGVLQDLFFAIFATLTGDADVVSHRPEWRTIEIPPAIPGGAIKKGIIDFGRDTGKPLYSVHVDSF